jgi:hypothetical protein
VAGSETAMIWFSAVEVCMFLYLKRYMAVLPINLVVSLQVCLLKCTAFVPNPGILGSEASRLRDRELPSQMWPA